jgi:sugar phosphate permease
VTTTTTTTSSSGAGGTRLHYGWIVAAVTFVVLLTAAGVRSLSGLLLVPLEEAFGWSRASVSFAVAISIACYGMMGPFSAALMDRFGIRPTVAAALAVVAAGVASTSLMTQMWQMVLLWGFVIGLGTGVTAMVLSATVVNRWFVERRGLVMGLLTASTATGQLVFLPALAAITEAYGWRMTVWIVAAASAALVPVVLLLVRERPADLGLPAYGASTVEAAPRSRGPNPIAATFAALGVGAKSRDFWLLFGTFFICGASTNGLVGTHFIPACIDHGMPEVQAAGMLAMMGVCDFIGTTLSGWLSDRWNNRFLLFWYYALRGLSLLYLPFAFSSVYGMMLFGVFFGLDWIATVPPTVRLTADAFGKEKAAMIFGWLAVGHQIGAGVETLFAGVMRTALGGYMEAFMLSGALCMIAALLALRVGRGRRPTAPSRPAVVGGLAATGG